MLQIFMSYIMEKRRNRRFMFLFQGCSAAFCGSTSALRRICSPRLAISRLWLVTVFVVMVSTGNSSVGPGSGEQP